VQISEVPLQPGKSSASNGVPQPAPEPIRRKTIRTILNRRSWYAKMVSPGPAAGQTLSCPSFLATASTTPRPELKIPAPVGHCTTGFGWRWSGCLSGQFPNTLARLQHVCPCPSGQSFELPQDEFAYSLPAHSSGKYLNFSGPVQSPKRGCVSPGLTPGWVTCPDGSGFRCT
jgi:hypothetical protein